MVTPSSSNFLKKLTSGTILDPHPIRTSPGGSGLRRLLPPVPQQNPAVSQHRRVAGPEDPRSERTERGLSQAAGATLVTVASDGQVPTLSADKLPSRTLRNCLPECGR